MKKRYNSATLFLLPLLDNTLTYNDYLNAGFQDLYMGDINRPYLNQEKIFLMFESHQFYSSNLSIKLKQNENYYNSYSIRVKSKWYSIFVFTFPINERLAICKLQSNPEGLSYESKVKILLFWKLDVNSNLHRALFQGLFIKNFYIELPEEDLIFKDPIEQSLFEEEVA